MVQPASQRLVTEAAQQTALAAQAATMVPAATFTEQVQDTVAAMLRAGTAVTLAYNDAGDGGLTITGTASTGLDAETIRDMMGVAIVGLGAVTVTPNDAGDTIAISVALPPTYTGIQWMAGTETAMGSVSPSALSYVVNKNLAAPPATGTVPTGYRYFDTAANTLMVKRSANPDVWVPAVPLGTTVIPLEVGQAPPATIAPNTLYVEVQPQ